MITYLDPARVTARRTTECPHNRSRTGYGSKLPTPFMLQIDGKRWHRVYYVLWSNAGSLYIRTKNGPLYLGTYDPRE